MAKNHSPTIDSIATFAADFRVAVAAVRFRNLNDVIVFIFIFRAQTHSHHIMFSYLGRDEVNFDDSECISA